MIGRGRPVPSSMPSRLLSEPAAMLRTTISSGMISTARISCSRMFRRLMKWFGTPMAVSAVMMCSEMRLFSTPLPSMTSRFCASKAVASSLKCWISVPGSGPS